MPSDRRKILKAIKHEGQKIQDPHARRVFHRAAAEIGIVETGLKNLNYGDSDSTNFRQERASVYGKQWAKTGGSQNIPAITRRLRQEFEAQYTPGQKSYEAAANIQRPRADLRGRYHDVAGQAAQVLKGVKGTAPNTRQGSSSSETTTTSYRSTPGTDYSTERRDAKLAYLQDSHNPDALLNLGLTLKGLKDTPGTSSKVVKRSVDKRSVDKAAGSAMVDAVQAEANRIDAKHYNYAWGGGHNPQGTPTRGVGHGSGPDPGYDCSGAIAKVLGIDPRVSADFAKWGKPGRAPGGKGVTVYSSPTHVLMEKDGHFFGTSSQNPGGGPGWIPRKHISAGYLKNFTARHA